MKTRTTWAIAGAPMGAVAVACVIAACGGHQGGNPNGPIAVKEKGRAVNVGDAGFDDQARCDYKGRDDREVSETAGPGAILPNVRRVYQLIGTGDDKRKVMVCREVDTNLDGVKDVVRTFNDKGEALHEEADANYDGKVDTWIVFANGRISKESIDTDNTGQPDVWKYYIGGQLSRIQRDTNKDGNPDIWEFYQKGNLERIGVDIDFDGHVDRWDHDNIARRAADAADRAEERSSGGARVNPDAGTTAMPTSAASLGALSADGGPDGGDPKHKKKAPKK